MGKGISSIAACFVLMAPICAQAAAVGIVCIDEKNETLRFDLDTKSKIVTSGNIDDMNFPGKAALHATEGDYSWDYTMPDTGTKYHIELDRSTLLMKLTKTAQALGFGIVFSAKCQRRENQL